MAVPESTASKKWYTSPSEREDCEAIADSEKVTYDAYCHCKGVHYTVRIPSLTGPNPHNVSVCNCSFCTKAGYLLVYPAPENHKIIKGEELLRTYQFASKRLAHKFCGNCGSNLWVEIATVLGGRGPRVPASVRMFRGVDLDKLNYIYVDGKNIANPQFNEETW